MIRILKYARGGAMMGNVEQPERWPATMARSGIAGRSGCGAGAPAGRCAVTRPNAWPAAWPPG